MTYQGKVLINPDGTMTALEDFVFVDEPLSGPITDALKPRFLKFLKEQGFGNDS
jgi:hypothetical protein